MLHPGDQLPQFSLPDQNNVVHGADEFRGKWLIVYFYPKDDTPGCTKEACSFRDAFNELQRRGVQVVGISKDSVASHQKFAEKYHLNFPLLSDTSKETIEAFGAWGQKKFMGREFEGILRTTFLVDPQGKIFRVYEKVNPIEHADQILKDLNTPQ